MEKDEFKFEDIITLFNENPILWIIVGISVISFFYRRRPVTCQNCGTKMTRGKLKDSNGCIKCGSDLYS
tara:strand:- start:306 stop:512 length:207 start_codon:yes stop_codon:yes gene_type:complete